MKKFILALCLLAGCDDLGPPIPAVPAVQVVKVIKHKKEINEVYSTPDFSFDAREGKITYNGNIIHSTTTYYLFADDGTYMIVDMATFVRTEEGSEFSSSNWKY